MGETNENHPYRWIFAVGTVGISADGAGQFVGIHEIRFDRYGLVAHQFGAFIESSVCGNRTGQSQLL